MRVTRLLPLCVVALSAGCAGETPTSALPDAPSALAASSNHAGATAFIAAQGTWCDRSLPGDCDGIDFLGIGWVNSFWDGTAPIVTLDPGGVNARWYAAHRQAGWPTLPAFALENGIVTEKGLPDGSRQVAVRLRVRNTHVAFYDEEFNLVLGAAFEEYGSIEPALATIDFDYEATLPAGFVGMPDLVQPEAWEGITRLDATIRTSGVLRGDLRGVAAGTAVDVTYRIREIPRGGGRSAKPNYGYAMTIRAGELSVQARR